MLERVEIERDPDAGEYVASCDGLRAVASGATEEEALANLLTALVLLLGCTATRETRTTGGLRAARPRLP